MRRWGRFPAGVAGSGSGTLGLLDLPGHLEDGTRHVDPARARLDTVEDGSAAPHAIGVYHQLEPPLVGRIARVEDESMAVADGGRADVVRMGPEHRAGGGAAQRQEE